MQAVTGIGQPILETQIDIIKYIEKVWILSLCITLKEIYTRDDIIDNWEE